MVYVVAPDVAPDVEDLLARVHMSWTSVRDDIIATGVATMVFGAAAGLYRFVRREPRR